MKFKKLALSVALLSTVNFTYADEKPTQEKTADEIAQELANPNTTLGSLNFPIDYISYKGDLPGASSQSAMKINFQPSLPIPLAKSVNLFVRPLVPIIVKQPVIEFDDQNNASFTDKGTDLGDISFDVAVGKSFSNGLIMVGGVVGTLPTATDDALGFDQYLLGPEVAIAYMQPSFVVGSLFTHQWDVAGEDSFDTSITGGQYFYSVNLTNGWQIQAQPTWSYNHNAEKGQELTLPVGIGISKTTVLGGTPWKFGIQYWHYVKQADAFGPQSQIRITITPVIKLPW